MNDSDDCEIGEEISSGISLGSKRNVCTEKSRRWKVRGWSGGSGSCDRVNSVTRLMTRPHGSFLCAPPFYWDKVKATSSILFRSNVFNLSVLDFVFKGTNFCRNCSSKPKKISIHVYAPCWNAFSLKIWKVRKAVRKGRFFLLTISIIRTISAIFEDIKFMYPGILLHRMLCVNRIFPQIFRNAVLQYSNCNEATKREKEECVQFRIVQLLRGIND